jgi:hypothetical protein
MRWMSLDGTSLSALEASLPGPPWPHPLDLFPARHHSIPDILRNDSQEIVLNNMPLGFWFWEFAKAPGSGIAPGLGSIPDPSTNVLLIPQKTADRGG